MPRVLSIRDEQGKAALRNGTGVYIGRWSPSYQVNSPLRNPYAIDGGHITREKAIALFRAY